MLVSPTVEYTGEPYNAYDVDDYALNLKRMVATIFFGRYWVEDGTKTYVDTVSLELTPAETQERVDAIITGRSLGQEIMPWAFAKGLEHGIIPADAVPS